MAYQIEAANYLPSCLRISQDYLSNESSEVLLMIFSYLPTKTLLNLSETCRRLREVCLECDVLWKRLIKVDFDAELLVRGPFPSFFVLYQLVYKFRIILEDTDYCTYSGYLPDWLYYWSALSTKPPLPGFFSLPAGRTKKTWGLTDEDLIKYQMKCNELRAHRLERYYTWVHGMEAAICKHGSKKRFQEVALKRCMRSQKHIHKNFHRAACAVRKRQFSKFQNENHTYKNMLTKCKGNQVEYLCYHEPQKIGQDFIDGRLHKCGLKQLSSYIDFIKQLEDWVTNTESAEDIPDCVVFIYEKLSSTVYTRYVDPEEFMVEAQNYFRRVESVWDWQSERGSDHRNSFRTSAAVKSNFAYKEYVRKGNEKDFETLRLNFEGLERLKTWMNEHACLKKLLDTNIITLMEGGHLQNPIRNSDSHSLKKMIKTFLRTGKEEDFKKILKRIAGLSQAFLDTHSQYLYNLRRSLNI